MKTFEKGLTVISLLILIVGIATKAEKQDKRYGKISGKVSKDFAWC